MSNSLSVVRSTCTNDTFVKIPFHTLDDSLDKIMKSRAGVQCINRILRAALDGELPDSMKFLHSELHKAKLYEIIELLTEISVRCEEDLFYYLCPNNEEVGHGK